MGGHVITTMEYGPGNEILTKFEDKERELALVVEADGLPPTVKRVAQTWRVEANGDDQSVLYLKIEMDLANEEVSLELSKLSRVGTEMNIDQLRYFAENDQAHPDKLAQLAKIQS